MYSTVNIEILLCVYSNCARALKILLDNGVDVNTKDASENTALMVAAALGHVSVLKVILAHPLLNIQAGVRECTYMYLTTNNTSTPANTMHGCMLISHAGFYRWHCIALCNKCKEEQVCSSPA